eukprot:TRINITY_DN12668_c1_g1_i1.p4 TRINITY_DN12668_c1_g1~~TRINITY_DN12668_c1_g1_i1.p4  ORF type:complete len:100 (-),score=9.87 TRINITY_DN12668_c1_g1_i1:348-647(-)
MSASLPKNQNQFMEKLSMTSDQERKRKENRKTAQPDTLSKIAASKRNVKKEEKNAFQKMGDALMSPLPEDVRHNLQVTFHNWGKNIEKNWNKIMPQQNK